VYFGGIRNRRGGGGVLPKLQCVGRVG